MWLIEKKSAPQIGDTRMSEDAKLSMLSHSNRPQVYLNGIDSSIV